MAEPTPARTFAYPDRPTVVRDREGSMSNPAGWATVLLAPDGETVVAAWDEAGVFWQWEDTETIVRHLLDALVQHQAALADALS